jgi:hypothetical protein
MRAFFATALIILACAFAGCGSDNSIADQTEVQQQPAGTTGDTETTGDTGTTGIVTASAPCQAAMADYHKKALRSDTDPSYYPDEGRLQVATLKACKSKAEWLVAVEPYTKGAGCIACAEPEKVYAAMCGGSDREKLPACSG